MRLRRSLRALLPGLLIGGVVHLGARRRRGHGAGVCGAVRIRGSLAEDAEGIGQRQGPEPRARAGHRGPAAGRAECDGRGHHVTAVAAGVWCSGQRGREDARAAGSHDGFPG